MQPDTASALVHARARRHPQTSPAILLMYKLSSGAFPRSPQPSLPAPYYHGTLPLQGPQSPANPIGSVLYAWDGIHSARENAERIHAQVLASVFAGFMHDFPQRGGHALAPGHRNRSSYSTCVAQALAARTADVHLGTAADVDAAGGRAAGRPRAQQLT